LNQKRASAFEHFCGRFPWAPMSAPMEENDLRSKIMSIMRDTTLSDQEKAKKRQELLMGGVVKASRD
jgi:hypothetical protein